MRAPLRIAAFRDRAEVTLLLNEFGDEASPAGLMRGAKAGAGGTVIVKSGVHTESGTVVISAPVSIIGETGAVIESGPRPAPPTPLAIVAVLDIKNTHDVKVRGISFRPQGGGTSNCTMLIESSPGVQILNNNVTEFQFGVWVEHGDEAVINGNNIFATLRWSLDPSDPHFLPESDGIITNNGQDVRLSGNIVSNGVVGIFCSDRDGVALGNSASGCYVGFMLCYNPSDQVLYQISGTNVFSDTPATGWRVQNNTATGNYWGFIVIDGANNNVLINNEGSGNVLYDIELTGDSNRFGFFTPASFNNVVKVASHKGLVVKDCGNDNVIKGRVTPVDFNADPCF